MWSELGGVDGASFEVKPKDLLRDRMCGWKKVKSPGFGPAAGEEERFRGPLALLRLRLVIAHQRSIARAGA